MKYGRTYRRLVQIACSVAALSLAMETAMSQERIDKVIVDVETNEWVPSWFARSIDMPSDSPLRTSEPWEIAKTVLRGGRQSGVDRIDVNNGVLRFAVIPTRGLNLWEATCGDLRLGWDSPVKEIVHPQYVHLPARGGLGWLEGFGEWISRCGLASNGAPGIDQVASNTGAIVPVNLTLHGKVSYIPARDTRVVVEPGEARPTIHVRGSVDETMMFGTQLRLVTDISTEVGSKTLTIDDEVHNLSATKQEFQLLYHMNFGPPLLEEGAVFVAPLARVTPRDARAAEGDMKDWNVYGPPAAGYIEQVFFLELRASPDGATEVLLRNKAGDRGVSMRFSTRELPCLTVWKNTQALENGYVTGVEPGTNYPNLRSFERENGRVPVLAGGGSHRARVTVSVLDTQEAVAEAESRVRALQSGTEPRVDRAPAAGLCPGA